MKKTALLFSILLVAGMASAHSAHEDSQHVETVIVASTANFPDALISGAPADKLDIPVLLTGRDQLSDSTRRSIEELGAQEVVIVGGPAVVSDSVQQEIGSMVNDTTRLWGMTQVGTSVEVAEYFWSEGSQEATIVQYPQNAENGYRLLHAVKGEIQNEDKPLLISKSGTLSNTILAGIKDLGATDVEVYSTNAVNVTQDLRDVGVENVEVEEPETGENEIQELAEQVETASEQDTDTGNRSTLVLVAAANFGDVISSSSSPDSASFIVDSEDEIDEAIERVRNSKAETIKIVGKPELARTIADRVESETNRSVDHVSGPPEEVSSQLTSGQGNWKQAQKKKLQRWRQEVKDSSHIREAANRSLRKAESMINSNSSEEAQESLVDAQEAFDSEDYFDAYREAQKAASMEKGQKYRRMSREDFRDEVEKERQDLRDATKELGELGQEQAQELKEAETVEERLEIIREYREERREQVRELREKAREMGEERREQRSEVGNSELKLQTEGKELNAEFEYTSPTAGYTVDRAVNRDGDRIEFVFSLSSPQGPAAQVVTDYEAEKELRLEDGSYTASVILKVDGREVNSLERQVEVPGFAEYKNEIENEDETENEEAPENETEDEETEGPDSEEGEQGDTTLPTELKLESSDNSFYHQGKPVEEIEVPANQDVTLTFHAREEGTYSAGTQYYSPERAFGNTDKLEPGEETTVSFTASKDFTIKSYWPGKEVYKTEVEVDVE